MNSYYQLCILHFEVLHLSKQINALTDSPFFEADERAIMLQIYTARLENRKQKISILESQTL